MMLRRAVSVLVALTAALIVAGIIGAISDLHGLDGLDPARTTLGIFTSVVLAVLSKRLWRRPAERVENTLEALDPDP